MGDDQDKNQVEKKFCRLCGKYRPEDEFSMMTIGNIVNTLTRISSEIQLEICDKCALVLHNHKSVMMEEMQKAQGEQSKIIRPNMIPPTNLKPGRT